ncbi:peptidase domain-containing ABC transporter [Moellerella wisconsensis]|uniref:Type I secretion system permease/ATPase n=2 Tax=Moellerella wisconsensis TaxID=158849 RepID=A0ACD3Y9B8_9GAMM|nr:type I secretion system permease/ATPase [Moellerella wisconsensis]KLN96223.1 peptidase C39 [Moellerella wisconsensis]UNH25104.1 type I secretion system permease/ATPase [Moellerella wisconsensis]UNH31711.1 type I secretion system permease/ATPase [Moellerella wisconsensis]UNH39747.1 type I secretion system permease/ATPase [Moellerella wisconsensis]UNH43329.1 type I secretion system permease/ATPase [Moellerella wisconsensis]
MIDKQQSDTLSLIGIIIKLTKDIDINQFNSVISESENFNFNLKNINHHYHVKCQTKQSTNKDIKKLSAPCIIYDTDGTSWLLANFNNEQVLIQPAGNAPPEIWEMQEFKSRWSGKWLYVKQQQSKFDISWFYPEFVKHKKIIGLILLFSFILQILALISPIVMQVIMDKVMVHNSLTTLDVLIIALVVAAFAEVILKGFREYIYHHTANRIDIILGLKLVSHLLYLPVSFFKSRQIGAIVTRVKELETIREFLTGSLFTLCVDVLFLFVFIYVMNLLSGVLTLVFILSIPAYLLVAWLLTPKIEAAAHQQFMHTAINTSFLTESLNGVETVKSLSIEPHFKRRWEQQTSDMSQSSFVAQQIHSRSEHWVMFIQKIVLAIILWMGASEVLALNMTIGQLIAFQMMANHASQPLVKMVQLWGDYIRTRVAIEKLAQIINLPTEQHQSGLKNPSNGDILFNNLSFRYQPDMPYILQNFNLSIPQGETLGIVGTSGSGKSTLARLLLRLYAPEQGQITIDNQPLSTINMTTLRQQIGIVLQENFLFHQSVFDNIAQSKPNASLDEVINAAKMAGAHDFILKLPLGYDTLISEGGSSLSGGQRQRVAIARTLLSNPKIIIFDEATSALDDESQAIIQANMHQIAQGRTIITIAHRLSTIRNHQRIIVMQQGKIIEQGSHDELLMLNKQYKHLWTLQQSLK